jgi:hypothetical protein
LTKKRKKPASPKSKSIPKKSKASGASKKPLKARNKAGLGKGKKTNISAKRPIASGVSKKRGKAEIRNRGKKKISHMTNSRKSRKVPLPAPKKKRPLSKRKLRERALKGWVTRRKFEQLGPVEDVKKLVEKVILPKAVKQLHSRDLLIELASLHVDGSEAEYPSILRHLSDSETIYNRLWSVQGSIEEGWVSASPQEIAETDEFRSLAKEIANEYEVPVREVYTLFFSP